jgi:hypothetical protein
MVPTVPNPSESRVTPGFLLLSKTAQALADLIVKAHQALVLLDEGKEFATLV